MKSDRRFFHRRADTSVDKFTRDDVDTDMAEVMLISSTNMLMYNNVTGLGGIIEDQQFSQLGDVKFNNESIAGLAPVIYISMLCIFVMLYVFTFVRYLASAFLYAVIMYMISKMLASRVTLGTMYKIALFAQSIGAVVAAVANFIGTPILMMAGSTFAMIVTVLIMNRAFFKIVPPPTMM